MIVELLKTFVPWILRIYVWDFSLTVKPQGTNGKEESYSQFGQDVYLFNKIMRGKDDGYFVDIGANHPIEGSNTYLLELHGWKGIACEPQVRLRSLWASARTTECLPYVIGTEHVYVDFVESAETHGFSGVDGYNKVTDGGVIERKEQVRLDTLLDDRGVTYIDYLSIDVEGYEMQVLESVDLSRIHVTCISVENDIGFDWLPLIGKKAGRALGSNRLRRKLWESGYLYVARVGHDDFFVKKNLSTHNT